MRSWRRLVCAAIVLACCASAAPSYGAVGPSPVGVRSNTGAYSGSTTRYASLDDLLNDVNGTVLAMPARPTNTVTGMFNNVFRDFVIELSSDDPKSLTMPIAGDPFGPNELRFQTDWFHTTHSSGVQGVNNPNIDTTVNTVLDANLNGFIQLIDLDGDTFVSVFAGANNFDPVNNYFTEFTLHLSATTVGKTAERSTFWFPQNFQATTAADRAGHGQFIELDIWLHWEGLKMILDFSTGLPRWIHNFQDMSSPAFEMHPTVVSGMIWGIFQNTSNVTANNGFYDFHFAVDGGTTDTDKASWVYDRDINNALTGSRPRVIPSIFEVPLPGAGSMGLALLIGLGLVSRPRRLNRLAA